MTTLTPERIAEIRALLARAHPGPWCWRGNGNDLWLQSIGGRFWDTVMGFRRSGMQGAQPTFNVDGLMHPGLTFAERPESHNPWKITGLNHPDADLIAAAPVAITELLGHTEAQATEIERYRRALMSLAQRQPGYWDGDDYCCVYCENSTQPTYYVDRDITNALIESYHDAECPWVAARRALRGEAAGDGA